MARRIWLVVLLTPASLLAGAMLTSLFVHSGGFGLVLGAILAPGFYLASSFLGVFGELVFYVAALLFQAIYCTILILGYALVRDLKSPPRK